MRIAISSDHRGYKLKEEIKELLNEFNLDYEDYGTYSEEMCDFPVFAIKASESVRNKVCDFGVVICGSGDGVCVASNKVQGIRCVCLKDKEHVIRARNHIDINVLALAAEETDATTAIEMIQTLISTPFLGDRYEKRLKMIEEYEKK